MLLPQDIATFSIRNLVLSCIILQGKVKTQSLCIISGFKKQSRISVLSVPPLDFHIFHDFVKYLETANFAQV